jgi:hypothetical protein
MTLYCVERLNIVSVTIVAGTVLVFGGRSCPVISLGRGRKERPIRKLP